MGGRGSWGGRGGSQGINHPSLPDFIPISFGLREFLIISGVPTRSHPIHTAHKFIRGIWDDKTGNRRALSKAASDGGPPHHLHHTHWTCLFLSSVSKFQPRISHLGPNGGGRESFCPPVGFRPSLPPYASPRHRITQSPVPHVHANLPHRFGVDR